ncbi:hypothetical protein MLD38_035029 [Melastoma candidum]|uniref:Uncharacterized protein n=1 Tax=Melastoma candidum TaxID=119954 RepID=A0ACB9MBS4_9MYRT|nr:hypothetical protein MLD38_035029 [Melastoma candidum]
MRRRLAASTEERRLIWGPRSWLGADHSRGRRIRFPPVPAPGVCRSGRGDLRLIIFRDEATARPDLLGMISDAKDHLERTFMSPASLRAGNLVREWMEDAGMRTWNDGMGNVHGRADGRNPSSKALLIGSHLDTVIDAGIFDGSLGLISAISALKLLNVTGKSSGLERPVERCPMENMVDTSEKNLHELKYDPNSVWGYVEVHIEQGPVLEWRGLPLGIVSGITGLTRLRVTLRGSQGHAGTVPMSMRQDPMPAAAELIDIQAMRQAECHLHDRAQVKCDPELNTGLKLAAQTAMKEMHGEMAQQEVPVGTGHGTMAMSHLTMM